MSWTEEAAPWISQELGLLTKCKTELTAQYALEMNDAYAFMAS